MGHSPNRMAVFCAISLVGLTAGSAENAQQGLYSAGKAQKITFKLPRMVYGSEYILGAKATSKLGIVYEVGGDTTAARVEGNRLTILKALPFTLTARQAGNADWKEVSLTLNADPARRPQMIAFTPPKKAVLGQTFNLVATVNSPLPVNFDSSNPAVLQVNGTTAVALAKGKATITARQDGNENFAPAKAVKKTIAVESSGAALVNIATVKVGDVGNVGDFSSDYGYGYGAVDYEFHIGKYEVTTGQYAAFLNAVAATNTNSHIVALWHPGMQSDPNVAGIGRSGGGTAASPYTYTVVGSGNRPASYVNWYDAARFCNWLQNGATNGADTENGAYALNGATSGAFDKVLESNWWLPTDDEWHKAAYYKGGGTSAGYWSYPTQSDAVPGNSPGGQSNQANYYADKFAATQSPAYDANENYLTDVGAFMASRGPYGTFDQAGNVSEWGGGWGWSYSDGSAVQMPTFGGSFADGYSAAFSSSEAGNWNRLEASERDAETGFRVVRAAELQPPARLPAFINMAKTGQPELPRYAHTVVWTGNKAIVWGGTVILDGVIEPSATGGIYDPKLDVWQATSAQRAPSARAGHTAVWAGDRMIVWGGESSEGEELGDGYAYFPDSGVWWPVSLTGAPAPRAWHTAVWTGTEMIVWGGANGERDGAAYSPSSNTWRSLSEVNAPGSRINHGAVWTGDRMAIWGGEPMLVASGNDNFGSAANLISLSVANNSQASAEQGEPAHAGSTAAKSLWWRWTAPQTGSVFVATEGSSFDTVLAVYTGTDVSSLALVEENDENYQYSTSALQFMATAGTTYYIAVDGYGGATGAIKLEVSLWGAENPQGTGAFYNPATDAWAPIAPQGAPSGGAGNRVRRGVRAVGLLWTGSKMVVIPGFGGPIGIYDPAKMKWELLSADGEPGVGRYMSAWTGSTIFIVGSYGSHARGSTYNFAERRWDVRVGGATGSFNGRLGVWAPELGEFLTFGGSNTSGDPSQPFSGGPEGQRGFRVKLAPPRP